jgi:hypothetical protein
LKWQKGTTVLKEVMPARMESNHLLVCPAKAKEAIFTTTYCKHGQRRAGKFCFHFDGDSIIILSDMLRHGFKKRTCHQSLAVHGNLPHLPNGKNDVETTSERLPSQHRESSETSIRRNNRREDAPLSCREEKKEEAQVKCYPFTA